MTRPTWREIVTILIACAASLIALEATLDATFAAGVIVKDSPEPVFGYLLKNDGERVVLREVLPGGATREREFSRAEIDELLVTVDVARLERLRPEAPREYLEYAEDLAEKRRDPEARDMALRLYLIAAWLAPEELGRGALLGMTTLARSAEERRAFRALAFALDADRDATLLREAGEVGTRPPTKNATAPDGLLEAIRHLRRGARAQAKRMAERKEVRGEFGRLHGVLSYDDFLAACLDPTPPLETWRALLQAELKLLPASADAAGGEPVKTKSTSWDPRTLVGAPALPTLSIEKITEFDPRSCVYVGGKWVERRSEAAK